MQDNLTVQFSDFLMGAVNERFNDQRNNERFNDQRN